jgi:hypothetical protein
MACICYRMSDGRASHTITWETLAAYPGNESGYHEALKHEALLIDSAYAARVVRVRDDDCRRVWAVQQCRPWKCCRPRDEQTECS